MIDFEHGPCELNSAELIDLIHQYDQFVVGCGDDSFLEVRVPTRWIKLEETFRGMCYIVGRNKRKRDGCRIEFHGNKFIFTKSDIRGLLGNDAGTLSGTLKSDCSNVIFHVVMYKEEER